MCKISKYKKEAREKKLFYISATEHKNQHRYQFEDCKHFIVCQPSNIRNRKTPPLCSVCFEEKLKYEAKLKGLTFVGKSIEKSKGKKSSVYDYIFDKCKHKKSYAISYVRNGNPVCYECIKNKVKEIALQKGLTFVKELEEYGMNEYIFNNCGHRKILSNGSVRNTTPRCNECNLERFKKEAAEKNMTMLDYVGKGHYNYRFNNCDHVEQYAPTNLRNVDSPRCSVCSLTKLKLEAKEKKMELIRKADRVGYYYYKFDECNHEKQCHVTDVSRGTPLCDQCGDTYYLSPSNIYIIRIYKGFHSFLKMGVATNIDRRIMNYKLKKGYKAELIKKVPFKTNKDAIREEKLIHKLNKEKRLNPTKIKNYLTSGFTECYPYSHLDCLIDFLDEIKVF
jgi:hypothetical protein